MLKVGEQQDLREGVPAIYSEDWKSCKVWESNLQYGDVDTTLFGPYSASHTLGKNFN